MKIEIIPLSIRCSKRWGYGLSILGFNYNNIERAIGFNIYIDKHWDKDIRMFNIYFYNYIKRIKLKTEFKSHYICNYCKTPVSPNDHWCSKCDDYLLDDEITFFINRKK